MTVEMNKRSKIIFEWSERASAIGKDVAWANGPAWVKVYNGWEQPRLGIVVGDNPLEFLVNSDGVIGSRPVVVDFVENDYAPCPKGGHKLRSRSETDSSLKSMKTVDAACYHSLDDDLKYLLFEK
jgi:hypothetical protein